MLQTSMLSSHQLEVNGQPLSDFISSRKKNPIQVGNCESNKPADWSMNQSTTQSLNQLINK